MNDPYFVGIDVSKDGFDVTIHPGANTWCFLYTAAGIRKLIARLSARNVALACMEATGGYEQQLALALADAGFNVAVVNPRRMRRFADAGGNLAKTDRLDARVIAHFAAVMDPRPWQRPDPALAEIKELATRRQQLVGQRTCAKNRLDKVQSAVARRQIRSSITWLANQIARLDEIASDMIATGGELKQRYDLLRSVPGAGPVLALALTAYLPEPGNLKPPPGWPRSWEWRPTAARAAPSVARVQSMGEDPESAPPCIWGRWRPCAATPTSRRSTTAW